MKYHFSGRTNIDPAPITRKDSECSKNTSPDEDNVNESDEDIELNSNALCTDSSSSDGNDGYDEENEHTTEQMFTFFDDLVSDIYQVIIQYLSDLQFHVLFI